MNQELIQAARFGDRDQVEHLLRQGADIHAADNFDSDGSLRWAALNGHEAVVRLLLDPRKYGIDSDGADIHAEDDCALRGAALYGHEAVVRLLLNPRQYDIDSDGADIHALNDKALRLAAKYGREAVVRLLLDPKKYGLEIAGCDRNILAKRHPRMLTKIRDLEQQELYQTVRVMYYALTLAQHKAYTKGQVGALYQALDMNLS